MGGKYLLIERIGDGGMGSVWRAVHRGLEREVAVKIVDCSGSNADERIERFLREAKTCAAVRHRYVVDIFDVDRTSEGYPYMVMELLRGETLAERTARAPSMRVDELLRLLAQCLSGLGAVHRAGVVHRDLKPENIFLAEYAHEGIVPKIVDFGISRDHWQLSSTGSRRLTREGTVVGTPWYMSPEQARASNEVGPETDVYAIGVIAYEALTGRLPFDADSLTQLLLDITTGKAPPLESLRPDLPTVLSEVVTKALAHDPKERFHSALEMRAALLRALDGMPEGYASIVPSEGLVVLPTESDAHANALAQTIADDVLDEDSARPPSRPVTWSSRSVSSRGGPSRAEPAAAPELPRPPRISDGWARTLAIGALAIALLALAAALMWGPRSGEPSVPALPATATRAASSEPAAATPEADAVRGEELPEGSSTPAVVVEPPGPERSRTPAVMVEPSAAESARREASPRPARARRRSEPTTPPPAFRDLDF